MVYIPGEKTIQNQNIKKDIEYIDNIIKSGEYKDLLELHKKIDNKYNSYIVNWSKSIKLYNKEIGFDYELDKDNFTKEILIENLNSFKYKLEGYMLNLPVINQDFTTNKINFNNNNNNENNNNISISMTFDEARKQIEDMPGLNNEQTIEIKKELDDLEQISKENYSKKEKWEKIKPFLIKAMDRGFDIAIIFLKLLIEKQFGI